MSKDFFRVNRGLSLSGQTVDPTVDVKDGDMYYNTALQAFRGYSNGAWGSLGGGSTIARVTQSHTFTVGQLLYLNGSTYTLAIATSAAAAEVVGMVSKVIDSNTFEMTTSGLVTGLTGLTTSEAYFLSPVTPGGFTVTEPSTLGQVSLPIGVAGSATTMYVATKRGLVVGSTNARTVVALTNNATVTVQNVSAYDAGELSGWVYIDAGTDYRFYVSAPFAKNGAGSDYNISPVYVGDTPPVGFTMTVTAGGLIQITLPSIGSFVAASINFALNAPAVGATFPLSIDSTAVNFSIIKAKDASGMFFQENGGTQIGSISDNSDWVFGKTAGGNAHVMYGRDGNPTGYQHALNIRSSSAANSIFLNLGTYETGDYAWIQSLESDTGNPKPFKFWTGNIEAGGYSAAGAWTLGPAGSFASSVHAFNGGLTINGDGSTLILNKSATPAALQFQTSGSTIGSIIGKVGGGLQFYQDTNVEVGSVNSAGAWYFGKASGLGTAAGAYHKITGSLVTLSSSPGLSGNTKLELGTNFYRDGAGTFKANTGNTGVTIQSFYTTGTPTNTIYELQVNTTGQTADTSVVGTFATIAQATAAGEWIFGVASTNLNHLVYGTTLKVSRNQAGSGATIIASGDNGSSDGGSGLALQYNDATKWSIFQRNQTGGIVGTAHSLVFSTGDLDNSLAKGVVTPAGAWTLGPSGHLGTHTIRGNVSQLGNSFTLTGQSISPTLRVECTLNSSSPEIVIDASGATGTSGAFLTLRGNPNSQNYINSSSNRALQFIENGVTGTVLGQMAGGAWILGPATPAANTQQYINCETTGSGTVGVYLDNGNSGTNGTTLRVYRDTTSGTIACIDFVDGSNTSGGSITLDTTANTTTFNTSSDSRLKTNPESFDGLALIAQMLPKQYERICNPGPKEIGFYAQELHTVFPQAVNVGGEDSNLNPWGIDYGKLTPVLVKAIQELKADNDEKQALIEEMYTKIENLTDRIEALETP